MRDGAQDPGTPHTDEAQAAIDAARDHAEVLSAALDQSRGAILSAAAAQHDELAADLDARITKATDELRDLAECLATDLAKLVRLRGARAWVDMPTKPPIAPKLGDVNAPDVTGYPAAIIAALTPPEPPPVLTFKPEAAPRGEQVIVTTQGVVFQ